MVCNKVHSEMFLLRPPVRLAKKWS